MKVLLHLGKTPLSVKSYIYHSIVTKRLTGGSGFLRWGERGSPPGEDKILLFGKIFAEYCMKMKEVGPRAGGRP